MEIQSLPFKVPLAEWKHDIEQYVALYPDIIRELAEAARCCNSDDTAAWYAKCLNYNLPGSTKQMFGVVTAVIYKGLIKKDELIAEKLKLANYLGWCVELLHTVIYVYDDVLDQGTTRRNQTCWYKLNDASLTTPTDVIMIENGIYVLLRKHFRHLDCYVDLLELFQEMAFKAARGELTDYLFSKKSVITFNKEIFNAIVMDKTGHNALSLPGVLALHLAGVKDPQIFEQYTSILTELGHFCQVQNDFVDCYIHSDITGKIGTDIEDNKCSWLAVTSLQRANTEQKTIMAKCYGQNDPQKVARIRKLYEELDIPKAYNELKNEIYNKYKMIFAQASSDFPKEHFLNILEFAVDDTKFNKF